MPISCVQSYRNAVKNRTSDCFVQDKDEVVLWMNTVGPYHNRQETYTYFRYSFTCLNSRQC